MARSPKPRAARFAFRGSSPRPARCPQPQAVSLLSAPRSLSRDRGALKSHRPSLASRLEDTKCDPRSLKSDRPSSATVLKMRKKCAVAAFMCRSVTFTASVN